MTTSTDTAPSPTTTAPSPKVVDEFALITSDHYMTPLYLTESSRVIGVGPDDAAGCVIVFIERDAIDHARGTAPPTTFICVPTGSVHTETDHVGSTRVRGRSWHIYRQ